MTDNQQQPSPTWMDHHNLNFWLWACLRDAEAYLEASKKSLAKPPKWPSTSEADQNWNEGRIHWRNVAELEKYHFAMTMGSALRYLDKLALLFPMIAPLYEKAEHARKEGLYLRNMIEHAITNLDAAARGMPRSGFIKKSDAGSELPGDKRGIADATSVIIDKDGHWLGGRLNVERVIAELRPIYEAAQAIPPPVIPNPSSTGPA
jgi:hypothetical protein